MPKLVEGVDYTLENGLMVLTAGYLKRRGYCCESGCRNCPYGYKKAVILPPAAAAAKPGP